jgi:hypothetical protein
MRHGLSASVIIVVLALSTCSNYYHELIPPDDNKILSFTVPGQKGTSVITENSILITADKDIGIRSLVPKITISDKATLIPLTLEYIQASFPSANVSTRAAEMYTEDNFADHIFDLISKDKNFKAPALAIPVDFSSPVSFLVMSAKGSVRRYTIYVTREIKPVIITGLSAEDKVYDGTTAAAITGTAVIEGLMQDDDVTVNYGTAVFESANAGNNITVTFSGFSLDGADEGNYTLSAQPASVTANIYEQSDQIAFTDSSPDIVKTYGDAAFTNAVIKAYVGSGVLSYFSEDESVATVNSNGMVTMHKAGTAVITAHKAADSGYAESSCSYTLTVNPKPATISGLSAEDKVYDGTTAATISGTPTINGVINGDDVTLNYGTAAFANANVGNNRTVTFSGFSLGGADAGNYTLLAQPTATANITARTLTVTVGTPDRTLIPFDSADTQFGSTAYFSITVSGIVGSDTVTISLASNSYGITGSSPSFTATAYTKQMSLTYNGTATVPQTSALYLGLTVGNSNYDLGDSPVRPTVIDGQATTRRIPVTPANISAFNNYARTANGLTLHYRLNSDCTLTGTNNWTAIGTLAAPFTGSFDGNAMAIFNLNINTGADYQGMFGYIGSSAVLDDIDLRNGSVTGADYVGGVVGSGRGYTKVQNCYATGAVSGADYVGGVVGYKNVYGTVQNCYATGALSGTGNSVGGVVGYIGSNTTVQNCYATGAVSGAGNSVGGVVGSSSSFTTVQNCYATGAVSGAGNMVGGVVGSGSSFTTVQNCYATGAVSGADFVGGVVGYKNVYGTVQNCYATGAVSGYRYVGGVVGNNDISSTVQNCVALNPSVRTGNSSANYFGRVVGNYTGSGTISNNYARSAMTVQYNWNGTTGTNKTINVGLNTVDGADMTTADAVTASWWTAAGRWTTAGDGTAWDFTNVWNPPSGNTLPTLRNMPAGTQNPVIQN